MALTTVVDGGRTVVQSTITPGVPDAITGSNALSTYVGSAPMYVSVWLKLDGFASAAQTALSAFAAVSPASNVWADGISVGFTGNAANEVAGAFEHWRDDAAAGVLPTPGDWTSFIAGHDGSDARVWINGVLADTQASAPFVPSAGPLMLFNRIDSVSGSPSASLQWAGRLDAIQIYDRVLSSGEIAELSGTRGGGPNGLPVDAINAYRVMVGSAPIPTYGGNDGEILTIAAPDRAMSVRAERSISTQADRHATIATPDRRIQVLQ